MQSPLVAVNARIDFKVVLGDIAYFQDRAGDPHEMEGTPIQYLQARHLPIFQAGTPWHPRRKCLFDGACSIPETQRLARGE